MSVVTEPVRIDVDQIDLEPISTEGEFLCAACPPAWGDPKAERHLATTVVTFRRAGVPKYAIWLCDSHARPLARASAIVRRSEGEVPTGTSAASPSGTKAAA